MHEIELILALLVAVTGMAIFARTARTPYPILLVLGGLVLAATPWVPDVQLAPELVFLLFLPPLLYIAGFDTSLREVKRQIRSLFSLAVGLVLATTVTVAVVAHTLMPELGWPVAFVLGAIVSPPDAVAATAVLRGLGVPRGLLTLLEGESLFNDATALVAYQAGLAAVATASFSPVDASLRFVWIAVGGILVGLAVGLSVVWLRRRLNDPPVEITVSLLTPFAAYLPAEQLGLSGVLATATAGIYLGWMSPRIMDPDTRLRGRAVWEFVTFVLNSLVFILIGLQLSVIIHTDSKHSLDTLIRFSAVVTAAVILLRLVWVFGSRYSVLLLRWWKRRRTTPLAESRLVMAEKIGPTFVVGWAGMRGVVSLATALALPESLPGRDVLLFATFCVILVTLVGQGLSLPPIIRALGLSTAGADHQGDEVRARTVAVGAAVDRIDQLAEEWPGHLPLIDTLRVQYGHRAADLARNNAATLEESPQQSVSAAEEEVVEHRRIRRAVIDAERAAVLDLRDSGAIDDEAWRRVERDLDLEELRMES